MSESSLARELKPSFASAAARIAGEGAEVTDIVKCSEVVVLLCRIATESVEQ
jgi:hypothetical protein